MTTDSERRRAPRTAISDTLFIQSVSSRQVSPMAAAATSTASTINASATGLQVELEFEVLESAQIALWITMDNGDRTLVSGVIRWTHPTADNTYLVGIALDDESVPTITEWLSSFPA